MSWNIRTMQRLDPLPNQAMISSYGEKASIDWSEGAGSRQQQFSKQQTEVHVSAYHALCPTNRPPRLSTLIHALNRAAFAVQTA